MIALRSGLFLALMALSVVAYTIPIVLLGGLLDVRARGALGRSWARLTLGLLKGLCSLDYRVEGLASLPGDASLVFCKHQSAWETIALRAFLPLEQTWVLKQELLRIPFFGAAVRRFQPIAIDRSAGRRAMAQLLSEGRERLGAGRWVVIFPEGTRVAPGEVKPFTMGGAVLAERTGSPVVPIAHNAGVFWRRRALRKFPGCIEVVIGPAIESRGKNAAQINAEAEDWINRTVASLPGSAPQRAEHRMAPR